MPVNSISFFFFCGGGECGGMFHIAVLSLLIKTFIRCMGIFRIILELFIALRERRHFEDVYCWSFILTKLFLRVGSQNHRICF